MTSEIYIEAPPASVFEFFVDAEKLCRWLAIDATLDPRPGGACVQMHDGADRGGGLCEMEGTFLEIDPPTRVVFTWGFTDPAVHVPPGSSIVEVNLEPSGPGTNVRLVHRGLPDDEIAEHNRGWTKMLRRLADAIAEPRQPMERDENMDTICHEIWIKADAKTVFDAITTRDGLDGWWGKAVSAEPKVGHVVEFDHGPAGTILMRVAELVPNERLVWTCVSERTDPGDPASEWRGTELSFALSSADDDPDSGWLSSTLNPDGVPSDITILRFEHSGWKQRARWLAFCNGAWGATLNDNLLNYCERSG